MKKIVIGLIIMFVGTFLLLNNMGFFIPQVYNIVISWQALLIAIGFVLLFDNKSNNKGVGTILIIIGSLFLISKILPINISHLIVPILIIVAGIALILKATTKSSWKQNYETWMEDHPNFKMEFETWSSNSSEWKKYFNDFGKNITSDNGGKVRKEYVFSGSKEKWTQGKLRNVEIEAFCSGVEIDFTQTELADDIKVAAYIKVKSVFSGVIIYVPDDWNIMIQKTGVFGGFSDFRPNRVLQIVTNKLVILELESVFGGGEIRCYE